MDNNIKQKSASIVSHITIQLYHNSLDVNWLSRWILDINISYINIPSGNLT
jgi:hypothetical protein